jgi:hypothetical protein
MANETQVKKRFTPEQVQAVLQRTRAPAKPQATPRDCDRCHQFTMYESDNLSVDLVTASGLVIVTNLQGQECRTCGWVLIRGGSFDAVLAARKRFGEPLPRIPSKVRAVSGPQPGMYLPTTVVEALRWPIGTELALTMLPGGKVLIEATGNATQFRLDENTTTTFETVVH